MSILKLDTTKLKTKRGDNFESQHKTVSVYLTREQHAYIKANGINLSLLVREVIESIRYKTLQNKDESEL